MDSNAVSRPTQPSEKLKSKIVNSIIFVFALISLPMVAVSLSRAIFTGWKWIYYYHLVALITIWFVFIFRKKMSNWYKVNICSLFLIILSILGLYYFGVLGGAKLFFLFITIFTGLIIGRKQAHILFGALILILSTFAILYLNGILQYSFDIQNYINQPSVWIMDIIILTCITLGIQIIYNRYIDFFITSEKQLREKQELLKKSEERYRMLIETMNDGLGVLDTQNKVTYINKALCNMLEYNCDEVIGNNITDFFDDKNKEIIGKQLELRRKGISKPYEIEWKGKNDKRVITNMSPRPIYNEKGDFEGSFAVVTDITESKKAERNLKESEQKYRLIVENAVNVILGLTADYLITEFNPEAERIFGRKKEEVLGKNYLELFVPEDVRDEVTNDIKKVLKGEPTRGFENEINSYDGTRYNMIWNVNRTLDEKGSPAGIIAIGNDITARKKAEEQLRLTKFGIDHSHIGIFQIDDDGSIYYANDHACKSLGYSSEELLDLKIWNIDPNLDSEKWVVHRKKTRSLGHSSIETIHRRKDGTEFPVEVAINFVEFMNKKYSFSFAKDISERKSAEQSIKESEERYKRLAEASFEGIGITKQGEIIDVNDQICRIYGYKPEEFKKLGLAKLVHPDDREMVITHNRNNVTTPYTHRGLKKDGSILYLEIRADKIKINNEDHRLTVIRDITENKRAEQALKNSEEKFRLISEQSILGIFIIQDNVIKYVNNAGIKLSEISSDEIYNIKSEEIYKGIHPDDMAFVVEQARKKQAGEKDVIANYSFRIVTQTKKVKWIEIYSKTISYKGKPADLITMMDISPRKQAEEDLKESETRYRVLVENSMFPVVVTTLEGKVLFANKYAFNFFGGTADKIDKYDVQSFWNNPDERLNFINELKRKGKVDNFEFEIKTVSGEIKTVLASTRIIEYSGQQAFYNIYRDITERKKATQALRESEEKFRNIFDSSTDAIVISDFRQNILDVNKTAIETIGITKEKLKGKKTTDFVDDPYKVILLERLKKFKTENIPPVDIEIVAANNFRIPVEINSKVIEYEGKDAILSILRDITERKKATQALRESEEKYRTIVETSPDAVAVTDLNGKITFASPRTVEMHGFKRRDELIGRDGMDLIVEEDREKAASHLQYALGKGIIRDIEYRCKKKDGSEFYAEFSASVLKNINNEPTGFLAITKDVTEKKVAKQRIEERLLHEKILSEVSTKFVNLPIELVNKEINNSFEYIGKMLNIDRIYLWEISEDMKEYFVSCAWADEAIQETPVYLDSDSFPYVKRKMLNKEVFKFSSIQEIPKTAIYEKKHYNKYGIKSCIVIPLIIAENVIGCISFSTVKMKMEWQEELIRLFFVLGHVLSNALQRKNTELALRESEERFRLLIQNIPAVTWVTSQEGITTYISPNVEKVYGYPPETIYKEGFKLWFNRIHQEDAEMVRSEFQQLFTGGKAYNIEYRIKRKDGNWIWLHDRANVYQELEGVQYAYGVFSDITKQKNAELIIKENEIQYRTLYENANDAIFLLRDDVFIDCNPKTLDLFRSESHDIIGKRPHELSPYTQPDGKNSKEKSNELIKRALSDVPQRFEWVHKRKDNSLFTAEVSLNSIELKNEKLLLALVRDITEIKEKHKEILRAVIKAEEKERNRIARDIHDGASPILSTIKLLSQSLAQCDDEKLQKKLVVRIENAVREAITSLSEISIKLSPHILQNFGVVEAIRNFTKEISSIKKIKFNFKTSLKERLNENLEITIYRIVIELINNTLKYADASKVDIILLKNGNILLTYSDDGKGFNVDKTLKKKKGMGLHNLKTRIESVNGTYNMYSAPGKGVKLDVIIPQNE
ncbi:MAG: PAS domain S-box protein [Bacteroidales bacterium]|nr:MAG: PAS domain S-box protein [Bacteroidales bacterium]